MLKCLILSFFVDVIDEGSGFCKIISRDFSPVSKLLVCYYYKSLVYNKFGGGKRGGGTWLTCKEDISVHVKVCMGGHAYLCLYKCLLNCT